MSENIWPAGCLANHYRKIQIIDSHTGGEPTRIVYQGGPELSGSTMESRLEELKNSQDWLRKMTMLEPRGSEILVGAIITPPVSPGSVCGIIFFNNVGYLGMCGHGTIGLMETLRFLGIIQPGVHQVDTPVGSVKAQLHADNSVSFRNVPCWVQERDLEIEVRPWGQVSGDVAWGGNWFFLVHESCCSIPLIQSNASELVDFCSAIKKALARIGWTEIDHIELSGKPESGRANSRNFVLCPGNAYDRSPCGTGTSAKVAVLADRGILKPGDTWLQESITGSHFQAQYEIGEDGQVIPTITGRAHITGYGELLIDPQDTQLSQLAPFQGGPNE